MHDAAPDLAAADLEELQYLNGFSNERQKIIHYICSIFLYSHRRPLESMASTANAPILPVGVGYGVVVGIGFFFAILMCGISFLQVSEIK